MSRHRLLAAAAVLAFATSPAAARDATDWFEFTSHINSHFEIAAKVRMVELMWRVAYADGHLSDRERHPSRRIADLLHVPHGAYINAKIRAKEHRA